VPALVHELPMKCTELAAHFLELITASTPEKVAEKYNFMFAPPLDLIDPKNLQADSTRTSGYFFWKRTTRVQGDRNEVAVTYPNGKAEPGVPLTVAEFAQLKFTNSDFRGASAYEVQELLKAVAALKFKQVGLSLEAAQSTQTAQPAQPAQLVAQSKPNKIRFRRG